MKFTLYRNQFKTMRKNAEKQYYTSEFNKNRSNLRNIWSLIRSIIKKDDNNKKIESLKINGNINTNPYDIANSLNNYFSTIAQSLSEKIPTSTQPFSKYLSPPLPCSFGVIPTSTNELLSLSNSFKPTCSAGIDDINPLIAKATFSHIAPILAELINCSLSTGVVPHKLKIAKIVPIFKKGERDDPSNYRPISVLSFFSKYYEKIMYDRLNKFLVSTKTVGSFQYGFRAGLSPSMALMDMYDKNF